MYTTSTERGCVYGLGTYLLVLGCGRYRCLLYLQMAWPGWPQSISLALLRRYGEESPRGGILWGIRALMVERLPFGCLYCILFHQICQTAISSFWQIHTDWIVVVGIGQDFRRLHNRERTSAATRPSLFSHGISFRKVPLLYRGRLKWMFFPVFAVFRHFRAVLFRLFPQI